MSYPLDPPPDLPPPPPPPKAWALPRVSARPLATPSFEPPAVVVPLDADGLIAGDLRCHRCTYNLRGLSPVGACPECGTSIGWSIHGDFLRFSDPDWVKKLADAAGWLAAAALITIVSSVLGGLITGVVRSPVGGEAFGLIAAMLSFVGYWKLTTRDPGHDESATPVNIRSSTRVLACVSLLGALTSAIGSMMSLGSGLSSSAQGVTMIAVFGAALEFVGIGAWLLGFILFRRIALRIPDERLASQTRVVMWGFVCSYGCILLLALIVLGTLASGGSSSGGSALFAVLGVLGCSAMIGVLVFFIWWIVLIFQFRTALTSAAKLAQSTWWRMSRCPS